MEIPYQPVLDGCFTWRTSELSRAKLSAQLVSVMGADESCQEAGRFHPVEMFTILKKGQPTTNGHFQ